MNIEWSITKKRGNLRPVLRYSATLTAFEKSLCVPAVRIESAIPRPPEAGWVHCWPGQHERGDWTPVEFYSLLTPSHSKGEYSERITLPWRADNAYPEVERAFQDLRDAFERMLERTLESLPMNEQGRLETSSAAKRLIAPAFAAERFLRAVNGQAKAAKSA